MWIPEQFARVRPLRRPAWAFVVAASVLVGCSGSNGTTAPSTDPIDGPAGTQPGDASATLPPLMDDVATATSVFLAGDGAPLLAMLDVVRPLARASEPRVGECEAALAELSAGPPPDELGGLAGDVPDVVLSGQLIDLVIATDEFLTRCTHDGSPGGAADRLTIVVTQVDDRIGGL